MHRSKKLAVVVSAAVAVFAVASLAFAGIPGNGGVIHACYEKDSGRLRVTDDATNQPKACTVKEVALDWNQQGPKGDRGPSNAYWGDAGAKVVPANDNFQTEVVSTPDLPAGKYVVSAKVVARPNGLNVPLTAVSCGLGVSGGNGGTSDYSYGTVSSNGSGPVVISTLSMQNDNTQVLELSGGKAFVRCDGPVSFIAHQTKITAIQVESLTY